MKEVFTSIVRIKGNNDFKVVSVKSNKAVEINLFIELSKVLGRLYVNTPIKIGDIVCKNILNTGIDIISTKNIK